MDLHNQNQNKQYLEPKQYSFIAKSDTVLLSECSPPSPQLSHHHSQHVPHKATESPSITTRTS